jgi:hypothetical protein
LFLCCFFGADDGLGQRQVDEMWEKASEKEKEKCVIFPWDFFFAVRLTWVGGVFFCDQIRADGQGRQGALRQGPQLCHHVSDFSNGAKGLGCSLCVCVLE